MKKVILDTSFILSCIQKKIDFFEEIELMGMQIIIPNEVISEIKGIANSKKKLKFKENAKLALDLFELHSFHKVNLDSKNVDKGLINLAKKENNVLATLDKEVKQLTQGNNLIIRGQKRLELV